MTVRAPIIDKVLNPLHEFLRLEAAGGILLMGAAVLALAVANTPLAGPYASLLDLPLEVSIGTLGIAKPLLLWINDGLMAVFFLLVGLELKREVLEGHLSSLRRASLPAVAAAGGMIAPAACYAALNWGDAAAMKGWAIPTATDIAFAMGVLTLLGDRVPASLKTFLLSVAIFDDLGAIVIIALFYTANLSFLSLFIGALLLLGLVLLNRLGVTSLTAYFLLGIPLWVAVLKSGVHATLAGVLLAIFIPIRLPGQEGEQGSKDGPLRRLQDALHPWVAYGVLPLFAFANAGVSLLDVTWASLVDPLPLGISLGLFVGKQVGIVAFCWIAVRLGIAALPDGIGWRKLHGAALLCGIGFTMSLFIAALAFGEGGTSALGMHRLGIVVGTLASGLAGFFVLRSTLKPASPRA